MNKKEEQLKEQQRTVGTGRGGGRKEKAQVGGKATVTTGEIENMVSDEASMPVQPSFKATNYYLGGFKCNSVIPPDGTLARSVLSSKSGSQLNHFVMMDSGGRLYDPSQKSFTYLRQQDWELRRTNAEVFNLYLGFLKTQKEQYLRKAERAI